MMKAADVKAALAHVAKAASRTIHAASSARCSSRMVAMHHSARSNLERLDLQLYYADEDQPGMLKLLHNARALTKVTVEAGLRKLV